ncbi:helix-turn-helix domain-containing protein [Streptomyces sp. NPDC005962]|uniref:PucR family transcriptional regulator n=1 Tax=Streptomyces sp. NPDC005962 TaxID=3154466 RepID=UPI0033CC439C
MAVVQEREPVTEILRAMAVDADVCGELVRAARAHSPEVARLTEAETRSHVLAMIRAAGAWFGTFDRVEEQDFTTALLLGADRAGQGVPMTAVLRGVQAALTRVAEISVDRCRMSGVPDSALLPVILRLKEYGDAIERHVINGYHAAERGPAPEAHEIRTRLLRRVLVDGVAPGAEELGRAGIRAEDGHAPYHCLVAEATGPGHAHRLTHRFSALRGLSGLVEGRVVGLCARLPQGEDPDLPALVVASPAAPLDRLRPLYRLCVRAVDLGTAEGRQGWYELTDFAAEIAVADQPLLGAHLSDRLLGGLDPSDAFHRQLALTALTFLDCGRRLDQSAATLFTHPNTIRYRLGRFQQITGTSLTDTRPDGRGGPLETLHRWWALTTWLGRSPTQSATAIRDGGDSLKK